MRIPEPCLCGDPECWRCFPGWDEVDWDDRIAREEQKEIDRSDPVEEDE